MKNIRFPVFAVTMLYLIYQLSPFLGVPEVAIVGLFCLMPFALGWMVVRILKDGTPSTKTFDDQWYEDVERE